MATWPLACARAAALAVAESNALLSHLPTTTAIPPATVTPGCASIVPLTHAERPGSNTIPPTVMSTVETVDTTFRCLIIKLSNAFCSPSGASSAVEVTAWWHFRLVTRPLWDDTGRAHLHCLRGQMGVVRRGLLVHSQRRHDVRFEGFQRSRVQAWALLCFLGVAPMTWSPSERARWSFRLSLSQRGHCRS